MKITTQTYKDEFGVFVAPDAPDYIGLESYSVKRLTRVDLLFFPIARWVPVFKWKAFKLLATGIGCYCRLELPFCDIRFLTSDGGDNED